MIDFLVPGFLYSLAKDIWSNCTSRRRKLSTSEIVELRRKWKAEFEPHIWASHQKQLRNDVIIRDMKRIESNPGIDERAKGISPWFRADLVGTYDRGVLIGLSWEMLTAYKGGSLRRTDYDAGEKGDINVMLIGSIPFENIENVDWDGDEYYRYPHIYCFFSHRKQPYQHIGYYTQTMPVGGGLPFYTEVATYESV